MVGWVHCFGPEPRQKFMAEGHGGEMLLTSWLLESRMSCREGNQRKSQGKE